MRRVGAIVMAVASLITLIVEMSGASHTVHVAMAVVSVCLIAAGLTLYIIGARRGDA